MRAASNFAPAGVAALVSSCATTLPIYSVEPGRVVIGATDHLVLVDGEGRRSAREWANLELASQSRARGFFTVSDRSEEGFEVRVAGRLATVEGLELSENDAGLRVDVLEWSGYQSTRQVRTENAEGVVFVRNIPVHEASFVHVGQRVRERVLQLFDAILSSHIQAAQLFTKRAELLLE